MTMQLPDVLHPVIMALVSMLPGPSAAPATEVPVPDAPAAHDRPRRPISFLKCNACHSTETGNSGTGPSLAGLNGRKAGTLPDFAYSEALKNSGIIWNAETLDKWLAAPHEKVSGMCMPFTGFSDPSKRKEMIDYILHND